MHKEPTTRLGRLTDSIEETSIAICLGLMTLITFANVVARYIFDSNILWALELTVFLFAWLVLMGWVWFQLVQRLLVGSGYLLQFGPPEQADNGAERSAKRGYRNWLPADVRAFAVKELSQYGSTLDGKPIPSSLDENDRDLDRWHPLPNDAEIGLANIIIIQFEAL